MMTGCHSRTARLPAMRFAVLATTLLAAACATPGVSGDKLSLARRLADGQLTSEYWRAQNMAWVNEYLGAIPTAKEMCAPAANVPACETLTKQVMDEIREEVASALAGREDTRVQLVEDYAKVFAENYTPEEMRALIAFRESPVGRSVEAKRNALFGSMAAMQYARMRDWTDSLPAIASDVFDKHTEDYRRVFEGL